MMRGAGPIGPNITPEQDEAICKAFPKLYSVRHTTNYGLRWGLEISQGWYDLIWRTSALLEACIENMPQASQSDYHALQIKQKFTGLRFYMSSYTKEMEEIISVAEVEANHTCEVCGDGAGDYTYPPMELAPIWFGWRERLCKKHYRERADRDTWQAMKVPKEYEQIFHKHFWELLG